MRSSTGCPTGWWKDRWRSCANVGKTKLVASTWLCLASLPTSSLVRGRVLSSHVLSATSIATSSPMRAYSVDLIRREWFLRSTLWLLWRTSSRLKFDMETGFCFFGATAVLPTVGLTQGSCLAPAVCSAVCAYIEASSRSLPRSVPSTSRLHCRWVDDIYVVTTVWAHRSRASDAHILSKHARDACSSTMSEYAQYFSMKDECPATFVGLSVDWSSSVVRLQPLFDPTSPCRYPHFKSARPWRSKFSVVVSQIFAVLDRVVETDFVPAISCLFRWFLAADFPRVTFQKAIERVVQIHPFLRPRLLNALALSSAPSLL